MLKLFYIFYELQKTSSKHQEIYPKGEISDSPGSFGYEKKKKKN